MPRGGTRTTWSIEFWPNEEEALFIATRSKTLVATALTKEMIHVFTLARRGLLGQQRGPELGDLVTVVAKLVDVQVRVGERQDLILRRLVDLEARIARGGDPGGTGDEAGPGFAREVCRKLTIYAERMAPTGNRAVAKSIRGKADMSLRSRLHHTGRGRAWRRLPLALTTEARAALDEMLDIADTIDVQRRAAAQGELFGNGATSNAAKN